MERRLKVEGCAACGDVQAELECRARTDVQPGRFYFEPEIVADLSEVEGDVDGAVGGDLNACKLPLGTPEPSVLWLFGARVSAAKPRAYERDSAADVMPGSERRKGREPQGLVMTVRDPARHVAAGQREIEGACVSAGAQYGGALALAERHAVGNG